VRDDSITRSELERYRRYGLLVDADAATLSLDAARQVRRIRRLRRDLGLSYDTIALVVRLVERIEQLEGRRPPSGRRVRVLLPEVQGRASRD
jgi:hypothetical protein